MLIANYFNNIVYDYCGLTQNNCYKNPLSPDLLIQANRINIDSLCWCTSSDSVWTRDYIKKVCDESHYRDGVEFAFDTFSLKLCKGGGIHISSSWIDHLNIGGGIWIQGCLAKIGETYYKASSLDLDEEFFISILNTNLLCVDYGLNNQLYLNEPRHNKGIKVISKSDVRKLLLTARR